MLYGHYEKTVDRESAYEKLKARAAQVPEQPSEAQEGSWTDVLTGSAGKRGRSREGIVESMAKSAARAIGSQLGRQIMRGLFGSMTGGTTRRRR
ncbi:MAG: DUF853 family protein [Candidatus Manganitrophus sp.]|nr:MAG: DUF853 family protein [Candidatus Manganitrophus sp.]